MLQTLFSKKLFFDSCKFLFPFPPKMGLLASKKGVYRLNFNLENLRICDSLVQLFWSKFMFDGGNAKPGILYNDKLLSAKIKMSKYLLSKIIFPLMLVWCQSLWNARQMWDLLEIPGLIAVKCFHAVSLTVLDSILTWRD